MPYVNARIGKKLDQTEKKAIADMIASNMSIIPGKTADNTMIHITDDCDMYMGGEQRALIFVDMHAFGPAPVECKDKFVATLAAEFDKILGIPANAQYYNIIELSNWGANGHFK